MNETLTPRAARTTTNDLYYHSKDPTDSDYSADEAEGQYISSAESDGAFSEVDPAELALKGFVCQSFMAAVQHGNASLVRYYCDEHPDLELGKTRWTNGTRYLLQVFCPYNTRQRRISTIRPSTDLLLNAHR